jgi:single-strand DNA-binding protein
MAGVNKVILVGNLGKDPEVRRLENGTAVANFPLATSETYRDRNTGESKTLTEWHNLVVWRGLAEVAEKYLRKGKQIYAEGKLRTRSWEDQDKNMRYTTEVVVDNLTMLGSREDSNNGQAQGYAAPAAQQQPAAQPQATTGAQPAVSDDDDLPF